LEKEPKKFPFQSYPFYKWFYGYNSGGSCLMP
jgi:hypothetical protein